MMNTPNVTKLAAAVFVARVSTFLRHGAFLFPAAAIDECLVKLEEQVGTPGQERAVDHEKSSHQQRRSRKNEQTHL
jgi:hypothetical protein